MTIDLTKVPFSRFGSYFAISADPQSGSLVLRDLHGGDECPDELFTLELIWYGTGEACKAQATPTRLTLRGGEGEVNLCMGAVDTVNLWGRGAGIRLRAQDTHYDTLFPLPDGGWEYISYKKDYKYRLVCEGGRADITAPWDIIGSRSPVLDFLPEGDCFSLSITGYRVTCDHAPLMDFDAAQKNVDDAYTHWLKSMFVNGGDTEELAAYVAWSCIVGAEGNLSRPAMYSSKNRMANVWSWDNCFSALALGSSHPQLALDQLLLFADKQDASGAYPDFINDRFSSFSCVKPPVFGWTCDRLRAMNPFFGRREVVEQLFNTIERNTRFWMEYRRADGLFYYTHGNDSGWDNGSIFHEGVPVEAPDLTAHLIRQADALAGMAAELGNSGSTEQWKEQVENWTKALLGRLYENGEFYARVCGKPVASRSSLLLTLPIIIGNRLPSGAVDNLLHSLETRFLTPFGLATEELSSPLYQEDGYWLGPVWAPVMYLITDALRDLGCGELAKDYATRFLRAVKTGGMAENFDPQIGRGNCDPAFAWTASVCLLYMREFLN